MGAEVLNEVQSAADIFDGIFKNLPAVSGVANKPLNSSTLNTTGSEAPSISGQDIQNISAKPEDQLATAQGNTARQEHAADKQETIDDMTGLYQSKVNTPDEALSPFANADNARGEGRWGLGNNKNYNDTLKLSRDADYYNAMPTSNYAEAGNGTGIHGPISQGFSTINKPHLETEETREMQKSRQLDLNQKQLDQQLQAAIYRKDYDAFQEYYQQRYGIALTDYNLRTAITQYIRHAMVDQIMSRGFEVFKQATHLLWSERTARMMYNVCLKYPSIRSFIVPAVLGFPAPDAYKLMEMNLSQAFRDSNPDATPEEIAAAIKYINSLGVSNASEAQRGMVQAGNTGSDETWKNKPTKSYTKEN